MTKTCTTQPYFLDSLEINKRLFFVYDDAYQMTCDMKRMLRANLFVDASVGFFFVSM